MHFQKGQYKNQTHFFLNIELFEKVEKEVRNDIKDDPYEMIIIGQIINGIDSKIVVQLKEHSKSGISSEKIIK